MLHMSKQKEGLSRETLEELFKAWDDGVGGERFVEAQSHRLLDGTVVETVQAVNPARAKVTVTKVAKKS